MPNKTKKFKNSDELFLDAGLSKEEIALANFRVALCMEILKRFRFLSFTQNKLAELVKTSQANISRIINKNINTISTDLLLRTLAAVRGKAKVDFSDIPYKKAS